MFWVCSLSGDSTTSGFNLNLGPLSRWNRTTNHLHGRLAVIKISHDLYIGLTQVLTVQLSRQRDDAGVCDSVYCQTLSNQNPVVSVLRSQVWCSGAVVRVCVCVCVCIYTYICGACCHSRRPKGAGEREGMYFNTSKCLHSMQLSSGCVFLCVCVCVCLYHYLKMHAH